MTVRFIPRLFYYGHIDPKLLLGDPEDGLHDADGNLWQGYEDKELFDREWITSSRFC